jgi:cytochrome c biogenesis protein
VVSLVAYAGNLGLGSGQSQSVYQLDLANMHRLPINPQPLAVGQSMKLPDGEGTITFTGYRQWVSLAITYDPGQLPALISGVLALAGLILSFMVRRRRVFVRAVPGPDGATVVNVGGLARSDAAGGFEVEFDELTRDLRASQDGHARAVIRTAPPRPAPLADDPVGAEVPDDEPATGTHDTTEPDASSATGRLDSNSSGGPVPGPAETLGSGSPGSASTDNDQSLDTPEGE